MSTLTRHREHGDDPKRQAIPTLTKLSRYHLEKQQVKSVFLLLRYIAMLYYPNLPQLPDLHEKFPNIPIITNSQYVIPLIHPPNHLTKNRLSLSFPLHLPLTHPS